jgi:hypothetical protein
VERASFDDPADELFSGRGPGRVLVVLGLLVALAGFAGWVYVVFGFFDEGAADPFAPGRPTAPMISRGR